MFNDIRYPETLQIDPNSAEGPSDTLRFHQARKINEEPKEIYLGPTMNSLVDVSPRRAHEMETDNLILNDDYRVLSPILLSSFVWRMAHDDIYV